MKDYGLKPDFHERYVTRSAAARNKNRSRRMMVAWSSLALLILVIFAMASGAFKSRNEQVSKKNAPAPTKKQPSVAKPADAPKEQQLKVKVQSLNMRSTPEVRGDNLIRQLPYGETLTITKLEGNWYQVKDTSGREGYIVASEGFVELVK